MRLSDVLNKAPDSAPAQVENFMGNRRIAWGRTKQIQIGTVVHNFFCRDCGAVRTYTSSNRLTCLVAGDNCVSIDATLKCPTCPCTIEAWYIVSSNEDLYSQAPVVFLERYTENRRGSVRDASFGPGNFEDLLERAQTAYDCQLGAGSMIYLRKIFEAITIQVATVAGIPTTRRGGRPRPFKDLLEEVDASHGIIPSALSKDRYTLFSELSGVIHGDASEELALTKFAPCRQLVLSVIHNVNGNQAIASAIDALGWNVADLGSVFAEQFGSAGAPDAVPARAEVESPPVLNEGEDWQTPQQNEISGRNDQGRRER